MRYLTFEEYQKLGGKCAESAFPLLQTDVEIKLNYITFNKFSKWLDNLEEIPEVVKYLEIKLIDIFNSTKSDRDSTISSYSNGIETFSYKSDANIEKTLLQSVDDIAKEYLYALNPNLFYRGRYIRCKEQ